MMSRSGRLAFKGSSRNCSRASGSKSLLGMRVTDVLAAIRDLSSKFELPRMVLCGRRDAAIVVCFAAALEPRIHGIAGEEMLLSFLSLFDAEGATINAASILPGLLQSFGDIPEVLGQIAPRKVLIAAGLGDRPARLPTLTDQKEPFTQQPRLLLDWLSLG
jgi:hypothetical protein